MGRVAGAVWLLLISSATLATSAPIKAHTASGSAAVPERLITHRDGFDLRRGTEVITLRWWTPDILEVHLLPEAHAGANSLVLDP
ncbi:MAG: hypothetical protein HKM03_09935, partial [Steroidobacteraceae bacterium]|nr:hypothetical protein [Steroidobacteraceae bacterium]